MPSSQLPSSRPAYSKVEPESSSPFVTVNLYSGIRIPRECAYRAPMLRPVPNIADVSAGAKLNAEEQLLVSQCKVLLAAEDNDSLTHDSSLRTWIAAWERAGIMGAVMTASVGDIELAKLILRSYRLTLDEVEVESWPMWGLKVIGDEQRQLLNDQAIQKTGFCWPQICGASLIRCKREGIDAPLISWLRAWKGSSVRNSFLAAVAGVGHCYQPQSISQCEMTQRTATSSYRISVLASTLKRNNNPCYVLSGYLLACERDSFFGYHPLTREHVPSIDVFSWLSSSRLAVTQQVFGSHPFNLIERSIGSGIAKLDGYHIMGLHVRKEPSLPKEKPSISLDVVRMRNATGDSIRSRALVAQRRMPGVYPDTWILDTGLPPDISRRRMDIASLQLCRQADPCEAIINNWLIRTASGLGLPMHRSTDAFRIAKSETHGHGSKYLLYPAHEFAVRIGNENASRVYSKFRLPIGSLIGGGLTLSGISPDDSHPLSTDRAIEHLIDMVRVSMRQPTPDLNNLLRWLVFDSLVGTISQIAYRYQVVSLDSGLALSPIPFWSTKSCADFCEMTRVDFGYQALVDKNEARFMFTDSSLAKLARHAGLMPAPLQRFRDDCLLSLKRSSRTVGARLESEAKLFADLNDPSFRNAKSMVDWISNDD